MTSAKQPLPKDKKRSKIIKLDLFSLDTPEKEKEEVKFTYIDLFAGI